ncbi:MAG: hypothetical protein HRU19_15045 [Pseudobacteriovorax sp.]|nr:hypothetical protein [Pseudobacteriovorax sp.]
MRIFFLFGFFLLVNTNCSQPTGSKTSHNIAATFRLPDQTNIEKISFGDYSVRVLEDSISVSLSWDEGTSTSHSSTDPNFTCSYSFPDTSDFNKQDLQNL